MLLTEIERGAPHIAPTLPQLTLHAARMLEEIGLQFDIASVEDPLPDARLIIWPGQRPGSPALLETLRRHLHHGGSLLAMDAALDGLETEVGARTGATVTSGDFFRLTPESRLCADWHGFAHVITQPGPLAPG